MGRVKEAYFEQINDRYNEGYQDAIREFEYENHYKQINNKQINNKEMTKIATGGHITYSAEGVSSSTVDYFELCKNWNWKLTKDNIDLRFKFFNKFNRQRIYFNSKEIGEKKIYFDIDLNQLKCGDNVPIELFGSYKKFGERIKKLIQKEKAATA